MYYRNTLYWTRGYQTIMYYRNTLYWTRGYQTIMYYRNTLYWTRGYQTIMYLFLNIKDQNSKVNSPKEPNSISIWRTVFQRSNIIIWTPLKYWRLVRVWYVRVVLLFQWLLHTSISTVFSFETCQTKKFNGPSLAQNENRKRWLASPL